MTSTTTITTISPWMVRSLTTIPIRMRPYAACARITLIFIIGINTEAEFRG